MPRKDEGRTKAELIAEIDAWRASQTIDPVVVDAALDDLGRIIGEIERTNVANFGLKPSVHERWKRELRVAQAQLRILLGKREGPK